MSNLQKLLHTARFHTTVARLAQLPRDPLPEVAFVGRSNAGKSSAINVLCQRKRLAFASKSPGRTQALNYYALGNPDEAPVGYLVDTPGYGFAAVPGEVKAEWDQLGGSYLRHDSGNLRGVVLLIDIRRMITERDRVLIEYLPPTTPLLVLITKADKLGRAEQWANRETIRRELADFGIAPERARLVLFSALKRTGVAEAATQIGAWILGEAAPDAGAAASGEGHSPTATSNGQSGP